MAMDPKDLAILQNHWRDKTGLPAIGQPGPEECPICRNDSWIADGPYVMSGFSEPGVIQIGGGFPVVVLVCKKCYYVRHFAWKPIKEGVSSGK